VSRKNTRIVIIARVGTLPIEAKSTSYDENANG
jgi:hypothetical protein